MEITTALLEGWMRQYYFDTEIDIGSSGVQSFSMAELRKILGLKLKDLDQVIFEDSQTLGSPGLRKAIGDRWANCDVDQVMATHGSSEGIFLAMNTLLNPGDVLMLAAKQGMTLIVIGVVIGLTVSFALTRFRQGALLWPCGSSSFPGVEMG